MCKFYASLMLPHAAMFRAAPHLTLCTYLLQCALHFASVACQDKSLRKPLSCFLEIMRRALYVVPSLIKPDRYSTCPFATLHPNIRNLFSFSHVHFFTKMHIQAQTHAHKLALTGCAYCGRPRAYPVLQSQSGRLYEKSCRYVEAYPLLHLDINKFLHFSSSGYPHERSVC